jgi:hypothetical protein
MQRKKESFFYVRGLRAIVPENIDLSMLRHRAYEEDRVWLSSAFRVKLIKDGIEKAGSINQLGRALGYRSRVHPGWSIRQILIGKQPFPLERLKAFSEFLDYPLEDIMRHRTQHGAVTLDSTRRALDAYGMRYFIPR